MTSQPEEPTQPYLCSVYMQNSLLIYCYPSSTIRIFLITCITRISSLLHSVNLILFTLLMRISLHHSHHPRSHHLIISDLKLISFTNPFLHSLLIPSGRPSWMKLYLTKWALAFFVLVSCARLS